MSEKFSVDDLLKAMAVAEGRWVAEEQQELTYDEIVHLQPGEKVTAMLWIPGESEDQSDGKWVMHRAIIMNVRPDGWTDLQGFWHTRETVTDQLRAEVRRQAGHEIGDMVRAYEVWFSAANQLHRHKLMHRQDEFYRGWSVEFDEDAEA